MVIVVKVGLAFQSQFVEGFQAVECEGGLRTCKHGWEPLLVQQLIPC